MTRSSEAILVRKVEVGICCNSPDNGMFTGTVEQIYVSDQDGDTIISIDGHCRITPCLGLFVRIGRHKYKRERWSEWVGNWCWDQLTMSDYEAARLLNKLRKSGRWDLEYGHTWAFEKWASGEEFTAEDFDPETHEESP